MSEYQKALLRKFNNQYKNSLASQNELINKLFYSKNSHQNTNQYNQIYQYESSYQQNENNSQYENKYSQESCESEQYDFQSSQINQKIFVNVPSAYNKKIMTITRLKQTLNKLNQIKQENIKFNSVNKIQQKKRQYENQLKKKTQQKNNFINKINSNLNSTLEKNNINQNNQKYLINGQNIDNRLQFSIGAQKCKQTQQKVKRSITQSNKKQTNSQISMSFISSQNKKQNSQKKKIKLKRHSVNIKNRYQDNFSQNNKQVIKQKQYNHKNIFEQKPHSVINYKQNDNMSMSKNQFLFLQQYQKDQKQIMNRLLNIIQKQHSLKQVDDKKNILQKSIAHKSIVNYQQKNRNNTSKPIVINNYIKSPSSNNINKQLIQRQIKIKLLEEQRNRKKINLNISTKSNNIISDSHLNTYNSLSKSRKSEITQQYNKSIERDQNDLEKNKENLKSNQKIKNKQNQEIDFEQLFQKVKRQTQMKNHNSQYMNNENDSISLMSKITLLETQNISNMHQISKQIPFVQSITKKQKNQQKQNNKNHQNTKKQVASFNLDLQSSEKTFNQKIQTPIHRQIEQPFKKKQNVLMQISFGQNQNRSENMSLSLADAFKKKFGPNRLPSQKKMTQNKSIQKIKKSTVQQSQNSQIYSSISQIKNFQNQSLQINTNKKGIKKSSVKISRKQSAIKNKENIDNQTARSQSQNSMQTDRSFKTNSHNHKQPSKQLLDRLIYGSKATISKKQMYELTKRNYMKLPQIQQKRKIQQKKKFQLERLEKIKEYQKKIRSHKNSISKQHCYNSKKDQAAD